MKLTNEYTQDISRRYRFVVVPIIFFFLVVIVRLYVLQIARGDFYRFFSAENSIKEIKLPAPRGTIYDRRGQSLVENRPAYEVVIIPQYVMDSSKMLETLSRLLFIPRTQLEVIWERRKKQPSYMPLVVKNDASFDDVALIRGFKNPWHDESDQFDLRGVEVRTRYERSYPHANAATHLLGYVREIGPEQLKKLNAEGKRRYRRGDRIGITGLEQEWDGVLRGEDGFEQRVVNAVGREVTYPALMDELQDQPPQPGHSLVLSIDRELQELARDQFAGRSGAAAMIDVNTGAVRVLFSAPSFDLNRLSGPEGDSYWRQLSLDPEKPLLNRAIQGTYPPGSTYKVLTGLAALSEGVVKPEESIPCAGAFVYGGRPYRCWNKRGHGPVKFHRSIVSSCDVFYYHMGLRLGVDRIAKYANMVGLGEKTGIGLSGERAGLIPTAEWKLKRTGVPWQTGENLSIAIGQGYDAITPLQGALMVARIVNGGRPVTPTLVEEIRDSDGNIVKTFSHTPPDPNPELDPKVLELVQQAMAGVVAEGEGTAHRLSSYKVTMGGKTGTAQVVALEAKCSGIGKCKDHAWFVGFAPTEKPEVAAAVIVEHGGFGASAAAPIVGALLQRYYDIEHPPTESVSAPLKKTEHVPTETADSPEE